MGKKLFALAIIAGAAYLYKTKHGEELRKKMSDSAGKLVDDLKEKFQQAGSQVSDAIDSRQV